MVPKAKKTQTEHRKYGAVFNAILAAALFGISTPLSKILLNSFSPMLMAALLYLGAGIGMLILQCIRARLGHGQSEAKITKRELPWTVGMILLDIAAPIFLMMGLATTNGSTVSLLINFEIVATSMMALVFFKESIGRRLWTAIGFITISSIFLSVSSEADIVFSPGALYCLLATACWGLENNCTRMMSLKDPSQIVIIKGLSSGTGSFIVALLSRNLMIKTDLIPLALLLGFISYGLSIFFYVLAQRKLGAARTSSYYAFAPFIGTTLSIIFLRESITWNFAAGLVLMVIGTCFVVNEKHAHPHVHPRIIHEHRHSHDDGHHGHIHGQIHGHAHGDGNGHAHGDGNGHANGHANEHANEHNAGGDDAADGGEEHSHEHLHKKGHHSHDHTPDMHHTHPHDEE